ncbi:MAG: patatin family protein [Firmicutes bacterium]|nr:patatin family protein [Bacillota bacterium]
MSKVGLVLEGGAMRGMYTVGVLDVMMDNNIEVDGIIGTSAGALFGPNYFSKQRSRALLYNKKYCGDKRFISLRSLVLTGNVVNKNFAFYKVTKELFPFDNETFMNSGKDYYACATDVKTGKPEYFKIDNIYEQLEELRASSAMPFASRMVKINNRKYLDGGISDSIPIDKMKSLGYEKIIVVLTQPFDYRKKPLSKKKENAVKFRFKRYPEMVKTMLNRHNEYNDVIERIIDMEKKKEVFVIRPSHKINIDIIEKNPDKLQEVYDLGVKDCKKIIKSLKKYLGE